MHLSVHGFSFAMALTFCWGVAFGDLSCYTYTFRDSDQFQQRDSKACQAGEVCVTAIRRVTYAVTEYERRCISRHSNYKPGCTRNSVYGNLVDCYCDSHLCNDDLNHGFNAFFNAPNGVNHKLAIDRAIVLLAAFIGIMLHAT